MEGDKGGEREQSRCMGEAAARTNGEKSITGAVWLSAGGWLVCLSDRTLCLITRVL